MAVSMSLNGVDLGPNYPVYGSTFEFVRMDEQGPAYKKVTITLSGFLEGGCSTNVMALYASLQAASFKSDCLFSYNDNGVEVHSNRKVFVARHTEPEDTEFAKTRIGDFSLELYYFADAPERDGGYKINASFNGYQFPKTPKWGRKFHQNRDKPTGPRRGIDATITLSGFLFGENHSELAGEIDALQQAFSMDGTLVYGDFGQLVRVVECDIDPAVINNHVSYTIQLFYRIANETDGIYSLKRRMSPSRIHQNPVITEEPFCDRRVIELMNRSGQFITYSLEVEAATNSACRQALAVEATNMMIGGGIEMPGGYEDWDLEGNSVALQIIKFYSTPVIQNLEGTGE